MEKATFSTSAGCPCNSDIRVLLLDTLRLIGGSEVKFERMGVDHLNKKLTEIDQNDLSDNQGLSAHV